MWRKKEFHIFICLVCCHSQHFQEWVIDPSRGRSKENQLFPLALNLAYIIEHPSLLTTSCLPEMFSNFSMNPTSSDLRYVICLHKCIIYLCFHAVFTIYCLFTSEQRHSPQADHMLDPGAHLPNKWTVQENKPWYEPTSIDVPLISYPFLKSSFLRTQKNTQALYCKQQNAVLWCATE